MEGAETPPDPPDESFAGDITEDEPVAATVASERYQGSAPFARTALREFDHRNPNGAE
jgi:hypothetical protein